MSQRLEGIELRVLPTPARNKLQGFLEGAYERIVPHGVKFLPQTLPSERALVIPRDPGVRGELTDTEIRGGHDVLYRLAGEIRPARRPITTPAGGQPQLTEGSVVVERVKRKGLFDLLILNRTGIDKLVKSDATKEFDAKVAAIIAQPVQNRYPAVITTAAQEAMQELRSHGIHVPEELVAEGIASREALVRQSLQPRGLERVLNRHMPRFVSEAATRLGNIAGLGATAKEIAIEAAEYEAITRKKAVVGVGGLMLGAAEVGVALLEDVAGAEIVDSIMDTIVGEVYQRIKFRRVDIFGQRVTQKKTDELVLAAGVIPLVPVLPTLLVGQLAGRGELRELEQSDPDAAAKIYTDIATKGLLSDYYQLNKSSLNRHERRRGSTI